MGLLVRQLVDCGMSVLLLLVAQILTRVYFTQYLTAHRFPRNRFFLWWGCRYAHATGSLFHLLGESFRATL